MVSADTGEKSPTLEASPCCCLGQSRTRQRGHSLPADADCSPPACLPPTTIISLPPLGKRADAKRRDEYLQRLMGPPNVTWHQIIEQASGGTCGWAIGGPGAGKGGAPPARDCSPPGGGVASQRPRLCLGRCCAALASFGSLPPAAAVQAKQNVEVLKQTEVIRNVQNILQVSWQ